MEVGSWCRCAPGRRKLEAGSWKLASLRSWKKKAGSWKLSVGVVALLRSLVPHTPSLAPCSSSSPHPLQNKNLSVSAPSAGGKKDISAPLRPLREEIKPTASQRSQRAGFSLIEVVSFVVIVAISFVVLVLVFRNAGDFSMKGDLLTQASQLAVHRMETIRSNNFDGIDTWDEITTAHGSITVTSYVYYVDPTIDLVTEVAGPTTMKRIVVQASSPETDIVTITSLYYQRPGIVY